jgi:CheY-like chemotaxis protein
VNILLIEDDAESVTVLTAMLEEEGHAVRSTDQVLAAFEILRRGRTDVILMDIGLPGMTGLEFTRKLRTYEAYRTIPVIAVSGMPLTVHGASAKVAGCDAYLEKPIRRQELLDTLASVAGR